MAYEVTKDRVDYTWVLTQQIERIARLATRYHQTPPARRGEVLAALKGAVEVLLDLAEPVAKNRGSIEGLRDELGQAKRYGEVMRVFREAAEELRQSGLLVRTSGLEDEAGGW